MMLYAFPASLTCSNLRHKIMKPTWRHCYLSVGYCLISWHENGTQLLGILLVFDQKDWKELAGASDCQALWDTPQAHLAPNAVSVRNINPLRLKKLCSTWNFSITNKENIAKFYRVITFTWIWMMDINKRNADRIKTAETYSKEHVWWIQNDRSQMWRYQKRNVHNRYTIINKLSKEMAKTLHRMLENQSWELFYKYKM